MSAARKPWRRCPGCGGHAHWVEPTWWCARCKHEWTAAHDPRFAPPDDQAPAVELTTCSFSEFREEMGLGVRISNGSPRWIKREVPWPVVTELVPSRSYLNVPDEDVFVERYTAQLRSHGVTAIREQFQRLAAHQKAERLVLLCFEKLTKGEPCHRRYFASWWQQQTGQEVPELGEVPTHEQLALDLGGGS